MVEEEEEDKNEKRIGNYIVYSQYIMEKYGLINDCLALYADDENQKFMCKIFLKKDFNENKKKIEEFNNTISIHEKLKHYNIFKLYEAKQGINQIYIFYEYIKGKTLEKRLTSNNKYHFEENEILNIIDQILDILIHLYKKDVILKDLTPRNIYIENKNKISDNTHALLCNLENRNLLVRTTKKSRLEKYYRKIVFKLGLIICKLLDKNFYVFVEQNEINEDEDDKIKIMCDYIEDNILKALNLSKTTREFIIQTVISGKESNTHINDLKEINWLAQYKKEIKNNKMKINNIDKSDASTSGSIINASFASHTSLLKDNNNNIKRNVIEEIINTDEGYLELYNKEKEVKLGIIDDFDREEILKNINDSNKYLKYYKNYCDNHESDSEVATQRNKDENKDEISKSVNPQKRKKKTEHKEFSIFKCYS